MESFEKKLTRKIKTTFFMCVCRYLRVRIIGELNGKSFKGVSKTKKKNNV